MRDTVLADLAALKAMNIEGLRERWRALTLTEPPNANRRYLESRLAYRIQELAYGGLKPETKAKLEAMGEQLMHGGTKQRRLQADKPVEGTRLIRHWQGVAHEVIVTRDGFTYQDRPYRSLSAIARAITGTQWNGRLFFGLKRSKA